MCLIKETLSYYKKNMILATIIYFSSVLAGIILFHDRKMPINPTPLTFLELLLHNSISMLLIVLAGIISFGILGNLLLIANGVILGSIFVGVFNNYGISPLISMVAPHFLFETLALLIAASLSYETYKLYYNIRHIEPKVIRVKYFLTGLCLVLIFLIIAALIESEVSQKLAENLIDFQHGSYSFLIRLNMEG